MNTTSVRRGIACVVMVAAVLAALPASAQLVTRQPYLQQGSPDSMVIVWRTLPASESVVRYGTDPLNLDQRVHDSGEVTHHELRITGLAPDTRYYYSVGTPDQTLAGNTGDHYFETSPSVGSRQPFRIWVVGDSGTGSLAQFAVRDAMLNHVGDSPPDLYLHMGDMAYSDGEELEFDFKFYGVYADILRNTVCWPTMGNHEGHSSRSGPQTGPYYEGYALPARAEAGGMASGTEAYYSFDYGNAHFVVLDSHDSPREPEGAMLRWLEADLASTDQDWLIAYWHHPPYTKGSHDSDVEGQLIEMRENALPILEAAGVDLVLGGHSHIYERSDLLDGAYDTPTVDLSHIVDGGDGRLDGDGAYRKAAGLNPHEGTVYIVAGHGGTGVEQEGSHPLIYLTEAQNGSCLIDIQGDTLELTNIRWDGQVSDHFTLVKDGALLIEAPRGGEELNWGTSFDIRWASFDGATAMSIEFSSDGGELWEVVEARAPNTGVYRWQVPPARTNEGLVRITNADNPEIQALSRAFSIEREVSIEVISWGEVWRYHDQDVDPGEGWSRLDFDDSAWPQGAAQLGYGDDDEVTELLDAEPNVPSVFFRKRIQLQGQVTDADFTVLHDDGVGVWVNGRFVYGKYVADGLGFDAFASESSDDDELSASGITLSPVNPFVVGDNVIGVMIKQANAGSSDVSFDMNMTLLVATDAPPIITAPEALEIAEAATLSVTIGVADPDGDVVSVSAAGLPQGAAFDPDTLGMLWTPTYDQAGATTVTFTATAEGASATHDLLITVLDVPRAPLLVPIDDQLLRVGEQLRLTLEATDPDGDPLTFMVGGLPGVIFDRDTRTLTWNPGRAEVGTHTLSVEVSDGLLGDSDRATITVNPEGEDPEPAPMPEPEPEVDPAQPDPSPAPAPEPEAVIPPSGSGAQEACACRTPTERPAAPSIGWVLLILPPILRKGHR